MVRRRRSDAWPSNVLHGLDVRDSVYDEMGARVATEGVEAGLGRATAEFGHRAATRGALVGRTQGEGVGGAACARTPEWSESGGVGK
jgi:hypothetical protein